MQSRNWILYAIPTNTSNGIQNIEQAVRPENINTILNQNSHFSLIKNLFYFTFCASNKDVSPWLVKVYPYKLGARKIVIAEKDWFECGTLPSTTHQFWSRFFALSRQMFFCSKQAFYS